MALLLFILLMLTILPLPLLAMASPKIWVGIMVPHRLMSITFFIPAILISNMLWSGCSTPSGALPPAAFTNPSIRPHLASTASRAATSWVSSIASAISAIASPPAAFISSARWLATSALRPRMPTFPPASTIPFINE